MSMLIYSFIKSLLMQSLKIFLIIIGTFIAASCQNEASNTDTLPDENIAVPHAEAVPDAYSSEEDIKKIANAKGKSIKMVTKAQFTDIVSNTGDELIVCYFWTTDCSSCAKEMTFFDKLQDEYKDEEVRVILINLNPYEDKSKVTTFVRQRQIRSEVMQLSINENVLGSWCKSINPGWEGETPATFFVRTDGDIKNFSTGDFESYGLLKATLIPLL